MDQTMTPLADALLAHSRTAVSPYDVPGHKGRLVPLEAYFGAECLALDKNSRKDLDYLCQPTGVISRAQDLAAEAFGAKHAFFMVGGTTSCVQAMIMSACAPGDKIILPRNVHISVINAVILSGAIPVYIMPTVHDALGIAVGVRLNDVAECIKRNTDAKAIFLTHPSYYGICSDIASIVKVAHENHMLVLVDEAHGAHFYFHDALPVAAMHCGADMSAVSMHKTGGSLTQSSLLLSNGAIDPEHINNTINLSRTTSASYLLMASIDIARQYLATQGNRVLTDVIRQAKALRQQINDLGGYYAFGQELIDRDSFYDFDATKISINTQKVNLAGIEVYTLLRDQYGIQIEFGDTNNILALCTIGDEAKEHKKLVEALRDIREHFCGNEETPYTYEFIAPVIKMSPRKAYYASKRELPLDACVGRISGDAVMCYPPGIPILAPGELVTEQIVAHIQYAAQKGCTISGLRPNGHLRTVATS